MKRELHKFLLQLIEAKLNMEYRPMSMRVVQTIALEAGYTRTLFKKVDRELRKEKVRAALRHVAKRKKIDSYECLVDFLYAELFLDQISCQNYYSGNGKKLLESISNPLIKEREAFMLDCLELATVLHERDLSNDWDKKTDLYIWNMWHHNNKFNSRNSSRTWTAFRTMALHLQSEFSKKKGRRRNQDETS